MLGPQPSTGVQAWMHSFLTSHINHWQTQLLALSCSYSEEVFWRSRVDCAVLDIGLFGEVLSRLNGRLHTFSSEESSQVGRVWRDENQRKKPPDTADNSTGHRSVATSTCSSFPCALSWSSVRAILHHSILLHDHHISVYSVVVTRNSLHRDKQYKA